MNNLCTWAELAHGVGDTIIETSTDSKYHVGIVHCCIGLVKAMHSEHAQKLSITTWVGPKSHQSISHWVVQSFHQIG